MRKRTTLLAALLALALLPACGQGSGPEPSVQEPPAQENAQRETLRLELTRSAADEDTLMQALRMLPELLPAALGIRNGDVKMIKNAGGMITGPFDSAVRSLLVGIIELGVEEVMVIGHTDCGVAHINADMMIRHLIQRGISQDHIDMMRYCGIDFEAWLRGFDCVENSVAETVDLLRNHPLMPADVTIRGYVINTETGELTPQE